jgi:hypothetical protein
VEPSFLEWASTWGRVFEISVQRGVLAQLIYQGLLRENCPVLEPWRTAKVADLDTQLVKILNLTDSNAQEWTGTMVRHLLVLGYGLGWSAMRECLKHSPIRKAKLEAIWCPLTLPGQQQQRDREIEETARAFHAAFNLPGQPDSTLLQRGQPGRADFLLWLSNERQGITRSNRNKCENFILCLEFSYNAPSKLADFRTEAPHREEISRYARYIDSRGVFSRVCAEVEGEEFLLSSNLANHLPAFSGADKPLFKLCQASSYTERLIHLLQACGKLQGTCSTRAIAVTPNGLESLAAHFVGMEEPDPRARLMKSLGEAYRNARKLSDDAPNELEQEIRTAFRKLVQSLPTDLKQQAQQLLQQPRLGEDLRFLFQEQVEGFYNPSQEISCTEAIAAIEETSALIEFFADSPKAKIAAVLDRQSQKHEQIPLRDVHAAAVIAGLASAQAGRLNVIALEGNPGIGKTTAVMQFLKQQTGGYLFLYLSPRVVINRDVTTKLARDNDKPSGILTITTNANLIAAAPKWYEQQVKQQGWERRCIDSGVVVDGIEGLIDPKCNTCFVTPEQEREIDSNVVTSNRFKKSLNEREDSMESRHRPGVLRTLASSTRRLLDANPQVSHLVMTAAIQGYRTLHQNNTTIDALSHLFAKKPQTKQGKRERLALSQRIPTVIVMVDELAGDGAGAPFAHKLADWLHQQFIEPFEGTQSPFKVILIIADASLSNEVVFNSYLSSGDRAPNKVLISQSQGQAPFRVTGTNTTKVGLEKHPILHIMTNSYPASELHIDYSIRLTPITPGLTSDGKQQTVRQAIREQSEDESLANAYWEIQRGLKCGSQQLIFFAQDKAFLRELKKKLTTGADALLPRDQVEVLDQNVPSHRRLELIREPRRDEIRVFLMTSSGARGVSFPKTDWIIASIPRFNIETALMEVAQLIYRGRGMYTDPETGTQVSGDNTARQLVMLINDFIVVDKGIERSRLWLRQASDLLTLLVMLRSTIHTRIKGDAGLRKQRIAFVPVGFIGDEELLNPMSNDVKDFLREAQIFICDEHPAEAKAIVKKAEQLTRKIFAGFNLTGQASDTNAQSYVNYRTLEALVKTVSRSSSRLLPFIENDALKIPEHLTCLGPFWMEDWGERKTEERFSFEAWRADIQEWSRHLLGLLRQIFENTGFPSKLKCLAKELYRLLIREKDESSREYSTLQAMRTENIIVSLPIDYPHFWSDRSEEDARRQLLEEPETWRSALGRALTPQGLVMPVVPQYQEFPWAAVAGHRIFAQLETIFSDRYFMASSELNLLNTILLEDEED